MAQSSCMTMESALRKVFQAITNKVARAIDTPRGINGMRSPLNHIAANRTANVIAAAMKAAAQFNACCVEIRRLRETGKVSV